MIQDGQNIDWAEKIVEECLSEAGDDSEAGLAAAEYLISTLPMPEKQTEKVEAFFSYDIKNRKAQGVLNRALQAAKTMGTAAKKELAKALEKGPKNSGEAILKFIEKYRMQLAKLLSATQLASLLEGAQEVATKVPVLADFPGAVPPPPTLEPEEAVELVDRLEALRGDERAEAIYELPSDQQTYARQALAAKEAGGPTVPPPFTPPKPQPDSPEEIHFPTIDEAVKNLAERNVMTRQKFDALDAATKAKSFTVANVDAEETLTKIRDVLAENVREGADYKEFQKKVMEAVDEGTFMSEGHQENVFRTNVQSAFSDGQMTVLSNPLVRGGFPYARQDAIHDNRAEDTHLAVEKIGIQGTNVFRINDPVFQTFRAPWRWQCRCGWTPMTVRSAAEYGIEEAQKWLDTGIEPSPPEFVSMPDFQPPPGFRRSIGNMPLSIQLSIKSLDSFAPLDSTLQTVYGPPLNEEDYPRDNANRFLDKRAIAEAARDAEKAVLLRDVLPEGERWKLDRAISHLNANGVIHHPRENPGLAIDLNGMIVNGAWAQYSMFMEIIESWKERDAERTEQRKAVDELTKTVRKIKVSDDWDKDKIKEYFSRLDDIDKELKKIVPTGADIRAVERLRHRVESGVGNEQNRLPDLHTEMCDLYEDVLEKVYRRIDYDCEKDPQPDEPEEPDAAPYIALCIAMNMDQRGIDHVGKGRPTGGQFTPRGINDTDLSAGQAGGERAGRSGTPGNVQPSNTAGQAVEGPTVQPGDAGTNQGEENPDQSAGDGTGGGIPRVPASTAAAIAKLDKFNEWVKRNNKGKTYAWVLALRSHIEKFGSEEALKQMGGGGVEAEPRENVGYDPGPEYSKDWNDQVTNYLEAFGIMSYYDMQVDTKSLKDTEGTLEKHGLDLTRNQQTNKVTGVHNKFGDFYEFGSDEYNNLISESKAANGPWEELSNLQDIVKQGTDREVKPGFKGKIVSTLTPKGRLSSSEGGNVEPYPEGANVAFRPSESGLTDKLKESKLLPGLESSEDINVLMGKPITHITDEVVGKLDEHYGKGQWIIKPYKEEGYQGHGIYFPERVASIKKDTKNAIWESEQQLGKVGYYLMRDPESGKTVGLKGPYHDTYMFGSPQYETLTARASKTSSLIGRLVTGLPKLVENEHGIPFLDRKGNSVDNGFMAQPAFPAVEEDLKKRSEDFSYAHTEARAHVTTSNGQANVVPYATFYKKQQFPIVFHDDDSREIERVAREAVMAVPESERQGHVYAPDIIKTAEGYKVVELNPSNEIGSSGHFGTNPLIIDSFVSHVQGRDPGFVQFIKRVLTKKNQGGKQLSVDPTGHAHRGKGSSLGGQFTRRGEGEGDIQQQRASQQRTIPAPDRGAERSGQSRSGVRKTADAGAAQNVNPETPSPTFADVQTALSSSGITDPKNAEQVIGAAQKLGLIVDKSKFGAITGTKDFGGDEHEVYLDANNSRVYKFTRYGDFGLSRNIFEYLQRMKTTSELWPELGYKFEGITVHPETKRPQVAFSMNQIHGIRPTQEEIHEHFRSKGWEPAYAPEMRKGVPHYFEWVDPQTGTIISDTHKGNLIKTPAGLVPIDVNISKQYESGPAGPSAIEPTQVNDAVQPPTP